MRSTLLLAALLAAAAATGASEKVMPKEPDGRRLFLARCSTCHDPGRVSHRVASRGEWREIVFRMQRMPQSGISKADANSIIGYLATLGRRRAPAAKGKMVGGRRAYGAEWLSILETAPIRKNRVTLGGITWQASIEGLTVFLRRGKRTRTIALTEDGKPAATSLVDEWRVGATRYELHLVLYRVRGDRVRVARALRRSP